MNVPIILKVREGVKKNSKNSMEFSLRGWLTGNDLKCIKKDIETFFGGTKRPIKGHHQRKIPVFFFYYYLWNLPPSLVVSGSNIDMTVDTCNNQTHSLIISHASTSKEPRNSCKNLMFVMWTDWSDQYEEVSSVSMIFLTSFKYPLNNVQISFEIFFILNSILSVT